MSWACDAMRDSWEPEIEEIHEGAKAMVSTEPTDNLRNSFKELRDNFELDRSRTMRRNFFRYR